MQTMAPKMTCSYCGHQIWVTWCHQAIRCHYCGRVSTSTRYGALRPRAERGFQVEKPCAKLGTSTMQTSYGAPGNAKPQVTTGYPVVKASATHPRKRAFLCGVTYKNKRKYRLKGTINDVHIMKDLLVTHFKFPEQDIRVLTEEANDPKLIPTKKNIIDSLHWLVEGNQAGDSLVFYFSGHGLRQRDLNGEERDGFDETICPVDFITEGMILDNEINSIIVRPLKKGVTLHAFMDSCHSGTVLDLSYVYDHLGNPRGWLDNRPPSGAPKGTRGGLAICLSACDDDQMAADTSAFSKTMNGAMTYILVQTLKERPGIAYGQLLDSMYKAIDNVNQDRCLSARIRRKLFPHKKFEVPQLSSSEVFDVYGKSFTL